MNLGDKQRIFAGLVAKLISHIYEQGYEVTFGEAYRFPEWAKQLAAEGRGIVNSLHCQRLAIDLNLFKDGEYLTTVEDWLPFGEFWESLSGEDIECAWGGRFASGDANHVSIAHDGRK
jgi:hypothetical protein